MISSDLAWAVGSSANGRVGHVYRLRLIDGRWQVSEELTTEAGLASVAATGPDDVWAVGENGLLVRGNGLGWRIESVPAADAMLRDIHVFGRGEEAWVVGDVGTGSRLPAQDRQPVALHYQDGAWAEARVEAPAEEGHRFFMNSVHVAPDGGAWAVGTLLWRLVDGAWRVEPTPNLCGRSYDCSDGFFAVRALDEERAWAAGSSTAYCGTCPAKTGLAYRDADGWRDGLAPGGWPALLPAVPAEGDTHHLSALHLTDGSDLLALGSRTYRAPDGGTAGELFALWYINGAWSYEQVLSNSTDTAFGVSMADPAHGLLVGSRGLIMSYGYGAPVVPAASPAARVPDPAEAGVTYFAETGHTLRGAFKSYWERYGGLEQFGYPLTEEYNGGVGSEGGMVVQYFERARMEYHPENVDTPYEVLLGLLGNEVAASRRDEEPFRYASRPTNQPGSVYFRETGHTMAAEFVGYWSRSGGLPMYGYPISEAFYEVNQADGHTYLVQYFERNRFEYHRENAGTRYEVLLGLLGSEIVQARAGHHEKGLSSGLAHLHLPCLQKPWRFIPLVNETAEKVGQAGESRSQTSVRLLVEVTPSEAVSRGRLAGQVCRSAADRHPATATGGAGPPHHWAAGQ